MASISLSPFHRRTLRFIGLFFAFVFGLTWLTQLDWVSGRILTPYTSMIAHLSGIVLRALNVPVTTQGTGIFHAAFAVDIRRGCDGVEATILLVSACLAYPLSWRNRALGTVWGYLLIFVANLIRVVGLFLIGAKASLATFNLFHVYVSQFAVIALTMVFWIYWIGRARTHNA